MRNSYRRTRLLFCIQFRLLNRRKGPAVQGPRAQADRKIYQTEMLKEIEQQPNLEIVEGEVVDFVVEDRHVTGVVLTNGEGLAGNAIVLTTGTFLRGVIHIGDISRSGGRMGDKASVRLAERIDSFNLPLGRLKTGTPPRLDGRTIDWDLLESQPGDDEPTLFSFLSKGTSTPQVTCGITHTNAETHQIIRENLSRSAMYGGKIEGIGPRYCPSIEDKVVRFADKESHQVFLEPEGLDDHTVYPNGISTSLPADVQLAYVRSMIGLSNVEIIQPGYAIEYDYIDPRALDLTLKVKSLGGLFLAGQINGTTGYEEAAAQGLVAGLNAALLSLGREPVIFTRSQSYIGVMIDDLTTRGVSEPYRMFTSRAEFRLSLRADNADQRLTPLAMSLGCISSERAESYLNKADRLIDAMARLKGTRYSPRLIEKAGIKVSQDGAKRTAYELLSFPDVKFEQVLTLDASLENVDADVRRQVERDALYANYIERQQRDIDLLRKDEAHQIPVEFDYASVEGLSNELSSKLQRSLPENLAQAARIDGMTPSALTLLLSHLKRGTKKRIA